jgi:hypothetical protein
MLKPYDWDNSGDFPAVKWKGASKVEVITGDKIGRGGLHPDIRHDDEIEMFSRREFEELKKKLDI